MRLFYLRLFQTHAERAPEDSWLDIQPHPLFSPDGDSFLMLAPIQEENAEFYTHIKHVTLTQQRISVLSHGRYEVLSIVAWDAHNHLVLVLALSLGLFGKWGLESFTT